MEGGRKSKEKGGKKIDSVWRPFHSHKIGNYDHEVERIQGIRLSGPWSSDPEGKWYSKPKNRSSPFGLPAQEAKHSAKRPAWGSPLILKIFRKTSIFETEFLR
ncbi:hypothetical protein OIU76_003578 [Salix suchowensis]|nr:hypothetical protein OIU76_003578 [Salix suchowensis]